MKQIFLFFSILCSVFSYSQVVQEDPIIKEKRIESLKIAFISKKLDLNNTEAEKFWPVYNRYENELKEVHKESYNMDVIVKDEKLLNIRKKYKAEFSSVLGSNRVNNLFKSENEFRAVLLRHIQKPTNQGGSIRLPERSLINDPARKIPLQNRK